MFSVFNTIRLLRYVFSLLIWSDADGSVVKTLIPKCRDTVTIKLINNAVCYSTCFLLLALAIQSIPAQQRAIVNASLEDPAFPANAISFIAEGTFPGWLTSHPINTCSVGPASCRPFERWSTVYSAVSSATAAGTRWVELNAYNHSMIYQNVCLTKGESFSYSFLHRGRGSATLADVAEFRLGIPTGLPSGSKPADPPGNNFPIVQVSTTNNGTVTSAPTGSGVINPPVNAGNGWRRYSGTYTYTGPTQTTNMGFLAKSTPGNNIAVGNFIDDWQIKLAPYVELSSSSSSGPEGTGGINTPANGPSIRIGGNVVAPITVIVQAGGTATLGTDYSLTPTFQSGSTATTAAIIIPAGIYDGTSAASIFPIPFSISTESAVEPDETVNFQLISAPGATIAGIAACDAPPVTNTVYTIQNDDLAEDAACCPPWTSAMLRSMMFYYGTGPISAPYTLQFQPTNAFTNQMQAYINYIQYFNSGFNKITIDFSLQDQAGTQLSPSTTSTGTAFWTAGGVLPSITPAGFFAHSLNVGAWYRIHTVIHLNPGQTFFSSECAVKDIDVRVQVVGAKGKGNGKGQPVLEFRDAKTVPISKGKQ